VVCFGPAGGGASFFRKWPDLLPADTELLAVQLPGRESRLSEPASHSIAGSADCIAEALTLSGGPATVLFGHSMGALLAFETAHRLRTRAPAQALALVVSGRESPDRTLTDPAFLTLPDGAFLDFVARRYGGIPIEVMQEPELRELVAPPLRADFMAVAAYREPTRPPLDVPLTLLTGSDDRQTSPERVSGWSRRTSGRFRERMFAGGHFYLLQHIEAVVAETLSVLEIADEQSRTIA
jgi:pyochelin biosynthetic protein PchC